MPAAFMNASAFSTPTETQLPLKSGLVVVEVLGSTAVAMVVCCVFGKCSAQVQCVSFWLWVLWALIHL